MPNRKSGGCHCCPGTTPPTNCSNPITVTAVDNCNGHVNPLPGVAITITRRSDGAIVATGNTGSDGKYQVYLPPVTGRGYEIRAKFRGYDPVAANIGSLEGEATNGGGQPWRVQCGCAAKPTFTMPTLRFAATAVACGNVVMPGVDVKLYKRVNNGGSPAVLLGQGMTDASGHAAIDLNIPFVNGDPLVGVATAADFYQSIVGFNPGPGNNPSACVIGFNVAQQSGTAAQYPDIPDLETGPRHTSNGWNARDYQQCCSPLSGMGNRYRPYPATLHVTVGPYSFDVTSTGGIWVGSGFQAKMQGAAKQPDGTYNCFPDPYRQAEIEACVLPSVNCDGLMLSYVSCHGMAVPLETDCASALAYMAQNPGGLDVVGIPCSLTSRSGDPLVMEGDCSLGHWVVSE